MNSAGNIIQRAMHVAHVSLFPRKYFPYPGNHVAQYIARDNSLFWPLERLYWKIWSTP